MDSSVPPSSPSSSGCPWVRWGIAGGVAGLAVTFLIYAGAFFVAFGNPTPFAHAYLSFVQTFTAYLGSAWCMIGGFGVGAYLACRRGTQNKKDAS